MMATPPPVVSRMNSLERSPPITVRAVRPAAAETSLKSATGGRSGAGVFCGAEKAISTIAPATPTCPGEAPPARRRKLQGVTLSEGGPTTGFMRVFYLSELLEVQQDRLAKR